MKRIMIVLTVTAMCLNACYMRVPKQPAVAGRPASIGIIGDTADVTTPVKGGVALIGGGGNVDGAFQWMIERSGGGDVVVLTASGNGGYNSDIDSLGKVNSVETLNITSRELANNDTVANIIRNAEMLFIAGGDQSRYMNQWRGTKVNDAINYLLQEKKVPVGGTSAGCAILSGFYYSGEGGSAVSDSVLANPYDSLVKVYNNDFLHAPYLRDVISDQHYLKRGREGRHVTFMSRIIKDQGIFPRGIAPDEKTAVCIDEAGMAKVFGVSKAYFILTDSLKKPELCDPGQPLQWNHNGQALKVYEIPASASGNGSFRVTDFDAATASGGAWYWWWVENGQLKKKAI
ncbi:cyanophycinase [Chitinophaga ginsengisegetis]|uniref:cyanophycinase n=1 Tax=Chitinophaga ginsengisegetis TaxID=393003 RepID=UPI000DBA8469|nr:cyanophycinase [Chitinophaga ginsengisegetis]MDR6566946.1 cyanophycinase-like exopeptidase [Chitinophaga ginsengisegetis]MDR6646676.1 cyanophycinase-like exopeptidase [Chitinophaga ginsengisegetis]MDR6653026.1 cyanophycinase-like exopeptidase [Chitinophaga ginsengisegetis]